MDHERAFKGISVLTFNSLLSEYDTVIPKTLADLERQRLTVIPEAIRSRNPAYLTKDELVTLMDWKIAHGKFRPALKKLVRENDGNHVQSLTEKALEPMHAVNDDEVRNEMLKTSVTLLSNLRGVGPATASLLLSTYNSDRFPFFSDELFCWAFWDDREGWRKKIKYNIKDYMALFAVVTEFQQRYKAESGEKVSALDVEKVAYVLGKQSEGNLTTADEALAKEQSPPGNKRKLVKSRGADVDGNTVMSSTSIPMCTKRRRRK